MTPTFLWPRFRVRLALWAGGVLHYQCRACRWFHPADAFYRLANAGSKCGRMSECAACNNEHRAARKQRSVAA